MLLHTALLGMIDTESMYGIFLWCTCDPRERSIMCQFLLNLAEQKNKNISKFCISTALSYVYGFCFLGCSMLYVYFQLGWYLFDPLASSQCRRGRQWFVSHLSICCRCCCSMNTQDQQEKNGMKKKIKKNLKWCMRCGDVEWFKCTNNTHTLTQEYHYRSVYNVRIG